MPAGPISVNSARPFRIGLLGQFGIGNLGNDGSLEAMLSFLRARFPSAKLVCICSDPAFVEHRFGVPAVPLRRPGPSQGFARAANRLLLGMPGRIANIAHAIHVASALDVLLVPGTGVLDDFGERPFGLPYDIWRWSFAAKRAGAKLGFVSIGAGPITRRLSRLFMINAARSADYCSYRDEPSRAFACTVGLGAKESQVRPDLAFSLPAPLRVVSDEALVAVGVMAYYGWAGSGSEIYERYVGKLSAYTAWLLETGRRVRFVIGNDNDTKSVEEVQRRALALAPSRSQQIAPFEPAQNLSDVMRQMADANIVVATRFHNVVCALRAGRPVISLGYAEKNHALVADMGLGAFAQEVETFDLALLQRHTDDLLARGEEYEALISAKVKLYQAELEAQEQALAALVDEPSQASR